MTGKKAPEHVLELGEFIVPGGTVTPSGTATYDGKHLELCLTQRTGEPIVHCTSTGRAWRLRWEDIVQLAINVGVHLPDGSRH
jgi:hypothetical protein